MSLFNRKPKPPPPIQPVRQLTKEQFEAEIRYRKQREFDEHLVEPISVELIMTTHDEAGKLIFPSAHLVINLDHTWTYK